MTFIIIGAIVATAILVKIAGSFFQRRMELLKYKKEDGVYDIEEVLSAKAMYYKGRVVFKRQTYTFGITIDKSSFWNKHIKDTNISQIHIERIYPLKGDGKDEKMISPNLEEKIRSSPAWRYSNNFLDNDDPDINAAIDFLIKIFNE